MAFGLRATVTPGAVDALKAQLAATDPRALFGGLARVHFARALLLDAVADLDGDLIPASLVLMTEADAPLDAHVAELGRLAGLDPLLAHCEGYTPAERPAFLAAHAIGAQATYVNAVGRTRAQIEEEAQLREALEAYLDAHREELVGLGAAAARARIQAWVRSRPELAFARRRAVRPPLRFRLREAAHLGLVTVVGIAALPVTLPLVAVWAVALRLHEQRDPAPHIRVDPAHARELAALEDHSAQNGFTAVGFVKPGPLRRATIRAVLSLIDLAARHVFTRADLAGVKSIHFARWTVLDDWRRAIFISAYDGSLESYMDDFIDKVAFGLNASFSNGVGYPRTRWLLFEGAKREEEFKDHLRIRQLPTQVFFSAYEGLSARNIEDNALIRSGLVGTMSEVGAARWLRRL